MARIIMATAALMAATATNGAWAQKASRQSDVTVFFRVNKWDIEWGYLGNFESLTRLDKIVDEFRMNIDSVSIIAYASPEGRYGSNTVLSMNRARAMRNYLETTYPGVDFKQINEFAGGPDFNGLTERLRRDEELPYRDEVLALVSNWGPNPDVTFARLKQLRGGEPYRYIRYKYLPWLRSATTVIFHYNPCVSLYKEDTHRSEATTRDLTSLVLPKESVKESTTSTFSIIPFQPVYSTGAEDKQQTTASGKSSSKAETKPVAAEDRDRTDVVVSSDSYRIHFRKRDDTIDGSYMDNAAVLEKIRTYLEENPKLDTVVIRSYASPEGSATLNSFLSDRRAESTLAFVQDHVSDNTVVILESLGEDWDRWTGIVEKSYHGADREKALQILRSNVDNQTKKARLKTLSPKNYYELSQELTKTLRASEIRLVGGPATPVDTTSLFGQNDTAVSGEADSTLYPATVDSTDIFRSVDSTAVFQGVDSTATQDSTGIQDGIVEEIDLGDGAGESTDGLSKTDSVRFKYIPLFALTTNLLYETAGTAATLFHTVPLTVGYEIPIGKYWSFYSNYLITVPWHAWNENAECAELMHWDIGAKWFPGGSFKRPFARTDDRRVLEGWYAYLGAGCGYYDFEHNGKGYQGEEILGSLGVGYGLCLDRHWSFDFALGLGPMYTRYRYYEGRSNNQHLMYRYSGTFRYFGITDARVKLTYLFYAKKRIRK